MPVVTQQETTPQSCTVTTDREEPRNELCGILPCGRRSLCRVRVESKSEQAKVMWRVWLKSTTNDEFDLGDEDEKNERRR